MLRQMKEKFYFINAFMEVDESDSLETKFHLQRCGNYFKEKRDAIEALKEVSRVIYKHSKKDESEGFEIR